jgi:thiol-disulfide isomerase/thioredoxin
VPLDLQPGRRVEVDLGGGGTTVTGRVVTTGGGAANLDLHKSLNFLLRKGAGIEPPAEFRLAGLDARPGWSNAWTSTAEGHAFIQTLDHTFVTLDKDGRFTVSGVPDGDYDLAIRLYEPPAGNCLVTPVGSRIVHFRVTEATARGASLDLGDIPVVAAAVPRPGEPAPDYAVRALASRGGGIGNRNGKYVLLDFWATYCRSCVADLPALRRLHETYGGEKGLAILGVNLDEDPAAAIRFVEEHRLPWSQGAPPGGRTDDPILSRFGVGSVPTYVLIGPDGKLIRRSENLDEIDEVVRRHLR